MCERQQVHNSDDSNVRAITHDRFYYKQKSYAYC